MRYFIPALFLLHLVIPCFSQFKTLHESVAFDEPEDGFAKLLQMKNGNTAYLHINIKEGMEVKIFDPSHKVTAEKNLQPKYSRDKYKTIECVLEISGNIVLMVNEADDKTPVLYRVIIDGTTGEIIQEGKIAELDRVTMKQGYAMIFGNVPRPDFFVRKDPNSDYYAVVLLNSFETDRNKRLQIVRYGPDNKEINRAYYRSPEDKYKYLDYLDMAVIGNDKVSVFAYAYNTRSSGGKESEMVVANLDAGSKEVVLSELPFSKNLVFEFAAARYNPITRQILLLAAAQTSKGSNEFETILAFIDPYDRKVKTSRSLFPMRVNNESEALFGRRNGFAGVPQDIYVNADGSFTVTYEQITNTSSNRSVYCEIGNVAVCRYDAAGEELQSYLIPKNHLIYGHHLFPFYHSYREGSATVLLKGNQYKSFAYLNGIKNSYLLFNDVEKNGESQKRGKITTIQSVKDCDGFYFPLNGSAVLPERKFVFGKPDARREHDLALFAISDYDRAQNIYTTLKLEKEGRSKQVQVVWLQPE